MIAPSVIIRRFGESPADDNAAVYGLRSTAARTNELEADERRRIIESEEGAFRGWLLRGVACCPRRWGAEWSRKHPSGVWACDRADGVTICSGSGLLSQMIERAGGRLMPQERACPGLGDPPGLRGRGDSAGRAWYLGGLGVGEQVAGTGEQLAGDRDGGDLLPAALGDGGVGGGELRGAPGGLRGLVEDPAQPRRALLGDVPVPHGQVRAADRGGEPSPAGQLAGASEA